MRTVISPVNGGQAAATYQLLPPGELRPARRNARTHSEAQVAAIVESLRAFGAINPVVVDRQKRIVAGHARWEAAKRLGLDAVPVLLVEHLGEDELRLYAIADNRLAERAGWDESILAIEFSELEIACPELSLSLSGFDLPRIEWLCAGATQEKWTDLDKEVEVPARAPVTLPGDLWLLGEQHRLLCGDSSSQSDVRRVMGDDLASVVATDPPYNLPAKDYSGKGKNKHADFAMGAGEMSRDAFTAFLASAVGAALPSLKPGALLYAFMDWKHVRELIAAGDANGLELLNICVWDKGKGGMGAFYRSAHELICLFKHGTAPHKNRVQLGRHGRDRTNIWRYAGMNSFGGGRDRALAMHATVKPVQMICDLLIDSSERGEIVFDGFGGSGTTLIAAEKTGRSCRLVELDTRYCDTIVNRFQCAFCHQVVHAELGLTFAEVAVLRARAEKEPGNGR
ncbi:MAG: ParB N-terminal domain-containing protein [Polaromonas sp.]|nr:ParB N-terminal domain-containing protein [Gemmatimonadaceae bacterium]